MPFLIQDARRHIPTGVGILSGLKDRPVTMELIQQQVQIAREMGFAGLSFCFYDTLWQGASGETEADRVSQVQQLFPGSKARTQISN